MILCSLLLSITIIQRTSSSPLIANVLCDDEAVIYINGKKAGSTSHYWETWTHDVGETARLIAVDCKNQRGNCGLFVLFNNGFKGDDSWKCSGSDVSGWYSGNFDDSDWKAARIRYWQRIWKDAYCTNWAHSYCRKKIDVSINTLCNYNGDVFADGDRVLGCNKDGETEALIPATTRVLAFAVDNKEGGAFIAADFSNGFKTAANSKWRCTEQRYDGWETVEFDDSDWKQATNHGSINMDSGDVVSKIWTDTISTNITVFCRGYMECGCEHRCQPHENGYDYDCVCPDGFVVAEDGFSCDFNECSIDNGGCSGNCINTDGGHMCDCPSGFELLNLTHCENSSECQKYVDSCTILCIDKEGRSTCVCREGYTLDGDRVSCIDKDECADNNGDCSDGCGNTIGSYFCNCSTGYELGYDNHSCTNVNECVKGLHNCTEQCEDTDGSFMCSCPAGFDLAEDLVTCNDIDECATDIDLCDQGCINRLGSYKCNCSDGYQLDESGHKCIMPQTSGQTDSLGIGTVAGVAVAAVVIALLISIIVIVVVVRRRKKKTSNENNAQSTDMQHEYYNVGKDVTARVVLEDSSTDMPHVYYNVGRETTQEDVEIQYEQVGFAGLPTPPPTPPPQPKSPTTKNTQPPATSSTDKFQTRHKGVSATKPESSPRALKTEIPAEDESEDEVDSMSKDDTLEQIYTNVASDELLSKPVQVTELAEYVQTMSEGDHFEEEFKRIPSGQQGKCVACKRPGIRKKLRFRNIKPYDHSIVPLRKIDKVPLSDFINANFLHAYHKPNYYIATQGPKDTTLNDFWRMIWEHRVGIIVMLTSCVENGNDKCEQYWPGDGVEEYGDIRVEVTKESILADFTIRSFTIEQDEERRTVNHFHYTTWPDSNVPEDGTSLIGLRNQIKEIEKDLGPPVVVHCSAGVGRTGTYIALDYLLEQAEAEGMVDICGCVNLMRENRMDMIQSTIQYRFVHTTLLEALLVGNTNIPCAEFTKRLTMLKKVHPRMKLSGIDSQYKVLGALKIKLEESSFETARLPENITKNRNSMIVPADRSYVQLSTRQDGDSDYINAVFVDGYRSAYHFIVTHMPLPDTRRDFWRMIDDYNISTVVMLNYKNETDEGVYLPDIDATLTLTPFVITTEKVHNGDNLLRRSIKVKTPKGTRSVIHISPLRWRTGDPLSDGLTPIMSLFKEVQRLKQKQETMGPVLVHCLDGVQRSGLFCAAYMMLDKMNAEQVVDVFNAVRKIRANRPEFIISEEQYSFLYDIAKEYMDSFELYANFR